MAFLGKFLGRGNREYQWQFEHSRRCLEGHELKGIRNKLLRNTNSEVSDFNVSIGSKENILSLKISMQDFSIMDVLKSQADLDKPIKDLAFTSK